MISERDRKQSSMISEVEDFTFQDSDNDVLEVDVQTQKIQFISMIKNKDVISSNIFNKSFDKQLEIIRSSISFPNQFFFVFFSKSNQWQIVFEFDQNQMNDLRSFVDDLITARLENDLKKKSFLQIIIQNAVEATLTRILSKTFNQLLTQIVFTTSKSFAFASFERFIFSSTFWNSITRELKQFAFDAFRRLLFSLIVDNFTSKFKIEKVSFFDFEKQEKNKSITIIVHSSKHVFYKNVYVFVERLQNMIKQHDEKIIENLVIACLRDDVLKWYIVEIDDDYRDLLRNVKLDNWSRILINRFKIRVSVVLNRLTNQKYSLNDIKREVTFKTWFLQMLRYVKAVNLFDIYNQLIMIWNRIDVLLRRDIFESHAQIIIKRFLKNIDVKISIWYEMIDRQISRQDRQIAYQRQQQFFSAFSYRQQYINRDDQNSNLKISPKTFAGDKSRQIYLVEIVAQNTLYGYHLSEIEKNEFDENEMSIN